MDLNAKIGPGHGDVKTVLKLFEVEAAAEYGPRTLQVVEGNNEVEIDQRLNISVNRLSPD